MTENTKPTVGKYGSIIQKARESKEPENQKTRKQVNQIVAEIEDNTATQEEPENQNARIPVNQLQSESKAGESGKQLSQQTSKPVKQQARKPEKQVETAVEGKTGEKQVNQQTSKPANQIEEEMVNLSIKVSKKRRRHWSAEAKRRDTTLVAAISRALSEKFGEPQD